jgi:drug/metabolite transporter (DMT)-like permease
MNIYLVIFLTLVAALFTSFSQFLFKRSLKNKLNTIWDILGTLRNPQILLGLLGYATGLVLYLIALSHSQLSLVFPIFASGFIFVTIISAILLREKVSMVRVVGILLIFAGIVIVALSA